MSAWASIPHGTTICAQGTASTAAGPPMIPSVDITPFFSASHQPNRFQSQTAGTPSSDRIPEDLSGVPITQQMIDDPNSVLRDHIASQQIVETTTIQVSTTPASPLFGGGADNIAFLLGPAGALTNPNNSGQNAQTVLLDATFWIETVEHSIVRPVTPGLLAADLFDLVTADPDTPALPEKDPTSPSWAWLLFVYVGARGAALLFQFPSWALFALPLAALAAQALRHMRWPYRCVSAAVLCRLRGPDHLGGRLARRLGISVRRGLSSSVGRRDLLGAAHRRALIDR